MSGSVEQIEAEARRDAMLIRLFMELDQDVARNIQARKFSPGTALAVLDIVRDAICRSAPDIRDRLGFPLSEKEALDSIKKNPQRAV